MLAEEMINWPNLEVNLWFSLCSLLIIGVLWF
jgi:hypothetical protein